MSTLVIWAKLNPKLAVSLTLTISGVFVWLYCHRNDKKKRQHIIFVTGRSGAGKTSLGENFKSLANFIHFDGDQYSYGADPIKDSGKVITTDTYSNRSEELIEAYHNNAEENGYNALYEGKKVPLSVWKPYYNLLATEIKKVQTIHKDKNILITQALYPYIVRRYLRSVFGEQLIFLIINAPTQLLIKRVTDRMTKEGAEMGQSLEERVKSFGATMEEFEQQLVRCMNGFDLKQNNEPNTYQIDVDENMTEKDVFHAAKQLLKSHQI